jgi:hypothetical protein
VAALSLDEVEHLFEGGNLEDAVVPLAAWTRDIRSFLHRELVGQGVLRAVTAGASRRSCK